VLNKNLILMLASRKTVGRAVWMLKNTVGRPALPYLRHAAAHAENPAVRRNAAGVARMIR